jgi:glycosyltransferase involved in cell wall biosynthesis
MNVRAPASGRSHISVCVCTFRRPLLLRRLLTDLARQVTAGRFVHSIVVVDNDRLQSAEATTLEFATTSTMPVTYVVEPRQNIALARNRAVANAKGDFVAFIDDDELPPPQWLLTLLDAYGRFDVAGVLGPVKPHFDEPPPEWVIKGRFYDRASYPTGLIIDWRKGRTGNVLLERGLFSGEAMPFRPEFLSGEDQDFFRRMIEKGHRFVWCDEAIAYEVVPPVRWKRTFMLKRALLRGATSLLDPEFGVRDVVKSVIAVPAYAVALPVGLVLGQHRFMDWLVRMFDHLGRLLALVGIRPIKVAYVTE